MSIVPYGELPSQGRQDQLGNSVKSSVQPSSDTPFQPRRASTKKLLPTRMQQGETPQPAKSQEGIVPANPIRLTNPESTPEIPQNRFNMEELTGGSTLINLEAALAIQVGKAEPVGYSEASNFFRTNYDKTRNAQCAWLFAEAEKAGQVEQLRQEFPDVEMRAKRIIQHMQRNHPQDIAAIMQRVSQPDYTPGQVRQKREEAAKAFEILFQDIDKEK